jgi:hypothetical protein
MVTHEPVPKKFHDSVLTPDSVSLIEDFKFDIKFGFACRPTFKKRIRFNELWNKCIVSLTWV